eukprot:9497699-Pyramimonas_sp.AAC.3
MQIWVSQVEKVQLTSESSLAMARISPERSNAALLAGCGPTLMVMSSATMRTSHSFTTPSLSVDAMVSPRRQGGGSQTVSHIEGHQDAQVEAPVERLAKAGGALSDVVKRRFKSLSMQDKVSYTTVYSDLRLPEPGARVPDGDGLVAGASADVIRVWLPHNGIHRVHVTAEGLPAPLRVDVP